MLALEPRFGHTRPSRLRSVEQLGIYASIALRYSEEAVLPNKTNAIVRHMSTMKVAF